MKSMLIKTNNNLKLKTIIINTPAIKEGSLPKGYLAHFLLFYRTRLLLSLFSCIQPAGAQTYITIGSNNYGGNHNNENTQLLPKNFSSSKTQLLITNSELTTAGLHTNEVITGLQWYVETDNSSSTTTFDVYIDDDYSSSTLPSSATFGTLSSTKVGSNLTDAGTSSASWHTASFTTNFTWDGTNNMVIQVCRIDGISQSTDQCGSYQGSSDIFVTGYNHACSATTGYYTNTFRPYIRLRTNGAPLPVELLYFNEYCTQNKILFTWATQSETNNDFFTIEKSNDTNYWEKVDNIKGSGTSQLAIQYEYDYSSFSSDSLYYFRLKQTDYDGTTSYSDVITSSCAYNNEVKVFPNPSSAHFYFHLEKPYTNPIEVSVNDIEGKTIYQQTLCCNIFNKTIELNLSAFDDGIYFLSLKTSGEEIHRKIIKQKNK